MQQQTNNNASLIWNIAELLRDDYKPAEYGKVILPFTLLRRLDCALENSKKTILDEAASLKKQGFKNLDQFLTEISGYPFYNTSKLDLGKISETHPRKDLENYLNGFSVNVRDIFDHYKFREQIVFLDQHNLLLMVIKEFGKVDLHPEVISNFEMGLLFEELIRRFSELSNEEAGHHFTPREVIRLMVRLIIDPEADELKKGSPIRRIYDPAAGTGGMLSVAEEYLHEINPKVTLRVFGQEVNDESYAICKADMLIKNQDVSNIIKGNTLSNDGHPDGRFEYMLSNPPFGVDWKKVQNEVSREHEVHGYNGRFGPGLPRVSDGSLLFLLTLAAKMTSEGSRYAIVLNGSPLFTGGAGSGESEIRRYLLENDFVEAIVGLPNDMFYNTGIATYIWVLNNKKPKARKHKVQLINGATLFHKMQRSLGVKRNYLADDDIEKILKIYNSAGKNLKGNNKALTKVFDTTDFGYNRITVERPLRLRFDVNEQKLANLQAHKDFNKLKQNQQQDYLKACQKLKGKSFINREQFFAKLEEKLGYAVKKSQRKFLQAVFAERDENAEICPDAKGNPEADPELRDYENVPLKEDIKSYFEREVLPHVPDAWINHDETKQGYEIPFNRHFYQYEPPRPLEEIDSDISQIESEILTMLKVVVS